MKWTDSIPTEEGFYFIKFGNTIHSVKVKNVSGVGLCVKLEFAYIPLMLFIVDQWSEKIPEPM